MDHVDIVVLCDLDDLVDLKIGLNGGILTALSDSVGFISLLTMHAQSVFMTAGTCQ